MSSIILGFSKKHPMKEIFELYSLPLDFTHEEYSIEVNTINSNYYKDGSSLLNTYGIVLTDFQKFTNKKKEKVRFMNFIEHSIKNSWLSDSITEIDFSIKNDHILFTLNGNKMDYINMGEFYIDNYQINCCGSYMFIRDIRTDKQYMYYGD